MSAVAELEMSPYQIVGADFLAGKNHALLADEMGLGKTCQTIRASDIVVAKTILVICPAVARVNWKREFLMWSVFSKDFKVCETKKDFPTSHCIVSFEYATAHKDRLLPAGSEPWDLIVVDESHFVKEPEARRTAALFGKNGLVRYARRMWLISGTPAPNNASELWPMLYTFGVTPLSYPLFIARYCNLKLVRHGGAPRMQILGTKLGAIFEIKLMLAKIMLRRSKEDVMKELPPIVYSDLVVEAGPTDLENEMSFIQYFFPENRSAELAAKLETEKRIIEESVDRLGFTKDGMKVLEGIADSVSTLRRFNGLQKVQPVADIVTQELEAGAYKKIVIFGIHRDVIEGLRVRLSKFGAVTLYGGTSPSQRQRNIDKFMTNKNTRVFIGNIRAAGIAITLTSADQVLMIEQSWVVSENAQAIMRVHRRGQLHTVFVRVVGIADSIDQRVANVLKRKARELTAIFDTVTTTGEQNAIDD